MDTNALRRAAENRKLATYAEADEQYTSDLAAIDRVSQLDTGKPADRAARPAKAKPARRNGVLRRIRECIAALPADYEFTVNGLCGPLPDLELLVISQALSNLKSNGEIVAVRTIQPQANRRPMNVYRRATPADAEQPQPSTNGEHAPEPELVEA